MNRLLGCLKSKTMAISFLIAVFGAFQVGMPQVQAMISPAAYGWISLGLGVVMAALRWITTTDLADK